MEWICTILIIQSVLLNGVLQLNTYHKIFI
ncbi:hypothetical protein KR49_06455 [Synechococcus sp. KORDI-49]|nr:hypothetical protein KR49_06455 [Synechococcus sp. KORDI-49]